ncbi:hypothetical protein CFIO01_06996 [Colletotrichum fioriniae PJ7]|uniref:2EXR domain-containing protein n=1 Tax=Colletotrichum fioriniae PJ7 TaxID=1445577 RepID=A0A010R2X5_9PEZI|nr:hypothetical protein CFIO01_06996 [Colletotrichum fioriniae PJ7]
MSLAQKLKREAISRPTCEMPIPCLPFVFLAHFTQTITSVLTNEAHRTTTNLTHHLEGLRLQVRGPEHTFHPFSRLPAELRLKIWQHACDTPRTLLATHAPNPALLAVNREVRYEALRRYTLVRLNTWGDRRIYIDFLRDTIAVVEGKGGGGFPVRGARHVIVVCEEPFRNPGSWLKCRYRAGLETLTLVLSGTKTGSRIPAPLPEIRELCTPEEVQLRLGYSKEEAERIGEEINLPKPQLLSRLLDHLLHNLPRRLNPINRTGNLPHQMRNLNILPPLLEIMLNRHRPALRQPLNLLRSRMPPPDVLIRLHTQRPPANHQRPLRPLKPARHNLLLVLLATPGLHARHEPRANPHAHGPLHQRTRETPSVIHAARGDHQRGRPLEHGRLIPPRDVHHRGDQHRIRHVPRVPAPFPALRADDIDAQIQRLHSVLRMPDHIHHIDPRPVQPLNHFFGGDPHRAHKQPRAGRNRNIDELVELAARVIVVRLARVPADLRQREVDAKGEVGGLEIRLHLGNDLAELVGGVLEAADDA